MRVVNEYEIVSGTAFAVVETVTKLLNLSEYKWQLVGQPFMSGPQAITYNQALRRWVCHPEPEDQA